MTIPELYQLFKQYPIIDTDTRTIREGSLFFALKGERFNGNTFAQEARNTGAAYAIVDEEAYAKHDKTILVDNCLETLQQLAAYHRNQLGLPIVALTGSNGKTTTKELINCVLSTRYEVVATQGNLNNHIGVPLTLLRMNKSTEIGIVEMGANHHGEIKLLCQIAQPNIGLITNFGKAHLEGFGSIAGVIKAKSELYVYLRENKGMAFVNEDDPVQVDRAAGIDSVLFGRRTIPFIGASPFVTVNYNGTAIQSQLVGSYNYQNLAVALTLGDHFNVNASAAQNAIMSYIPSNNRSQIIEKKGLTIIMDAYNANPTSMKAALENFNSLTERPKTVVLGDMFELGDASLEEHQEIVNLVQSLSIDHIYLIGKAFSATRAENALLFENFKAFSKAVSIADIRGSLLVKGSRGMQLERLLDFL